MNPSHPPTPERLVERYGQLMPVALILARLQRLLADSESGIEDIATLIRLDVALATRVVQISNSAWFRGGAPCTTILEAVTRVGFREVYHLVSVIALKSIVSRHMVAYKLDPLTMWRESVACACAADLLAGQLGEDTGATYMSGLLHAIGRIPIDHYLMASQHGPKHFEDEGFPAEFSGGEFALLGFNQAQVGAAMLKKWQFAESTIVPIRWQYEPLSAPEPNDRSAALLYAARLLRTTVCNIEPREGEGDEKEILDLLHLSRFQVLALLPQLQEKYARDLQIVES